MVPSDLYFTVKTQRHPTGFFPGGRVHFSHVSFFIRASISVLIAFSSSQILRLVLHLLEYVQNIMRKQTL
ncbi:hypothetical protein HanRHA438_Chr14g0631961 [Helianthus annuus]|nr:hypothetical protein HanRHA438_Chr14g0631961 [Helianthus annuus]